MDLEGCEMTKEEIRDMVKEADLDWHQGWTLEDDEPNRFETFAKLVAEKEREACAELIPPQYFHFRDWIRARGQE